MAPCPPTAAEAAAGFAQEFGHADALASPILAGQLLPVQLVLCEVPCPAQAWQAPPYAAHETQAVLIEGGQLDSSLPYQPQPQTPASPDVDGMALVEYDQLDCILPFQTWAQTEGTAPMKQAQLDGALPFYSQTRVQLEAGMEPRTSRLWADAGLLADGLAPTEHDLLDCALPCQVQPRETLARRRRLEKVQPWADPYPQMEGMPLAEQGMLGRDLPPQVEGGSPSHGQKEPKKARRHRRHRAQQRTPPVLKLPLAAGTSPRTPSGLHGGPATRPGPASGQDPTNGTCAEILKGLEAGGTAQTAALASLCGKVWSQAQAPDGCRAVQAALEVAPRAIAATLLAELRRHVREAVESPHANYVIQKAIEVLPGGSCDFVAEELIGIGGAVARHRYGCRVLCRLLEHAGTAASLAPLTQELLAEAADLCRHPFAHHVMQGIMEHGLPEQKGQVCMALRADLLGNAQHRCASHLVEAALLYAPAEEQSVLAAELLSDGPERLLSLAQSQFGSFVVRVLLRTSGESSRAARGHILQAVEQLWGTKYGQRVVADLVETPTSA